MKEIQYWQGGGGSFYIYVRIVICDDIVPSEFVDRANFLMRGRFKTSFIVLLLFEFSDFDLYLLDCFSLFLIFGLFVFWEYWVVARFLRLYFFIIKLTENFGLFVFWEYWVVARFLRLIYYRLLYMDGNLF